MELLEPHVPLIRPSPPKVRLPTLRLAPLPMFAVAVPVGAMLRLPVTAVPVGIVLAELPERMRLL